ncbi:MAG: nucleoside 2-deoxyribosyltransferase [Hyphomicrobiaceae bacterium]
MQTTRHHAAETERPENRAVRPRVYLAGPDVFMPNAVAVGRTKTDMLAKFGLEGVFPLDVELSVGDLAPVELARRISLTNEALMRSCDALIANLTPFRGVSVDAGTAFEIGFMRALQRPVLGYSAVAEDFAARSRLWRGGTGSDASALHDVKVRIGECDRVDWHVEDFGLADNLMIAVAISESGLDPQVGREAGPEAIDAVDAFEACARWLARHLSNDG